MPDIVRRLRELAPDICEESHWWAKYWWAKSVKEAADEIERLRGACDLYRKNQIADLKRLAEAERLLQEAQDRGLETGSEWADGVDAFLTGWNRRPPGVFPEWEAPDQPTADRETADE